MTETRRGGLPQPAARLPPVFGHPVRFGRRSGICGEARLGEDLISHWRRFAPLPHSDAHQVAGLHEAVLASGLTGRGGGHFPVAEKWRRTRAGGGARTVVANGAEGEPLSRKDAALLQLRPHLVLDGLVIAASGLGADDLVVWLHAGATQTRAAVERAMLERRAAGLVEPRIRIAVGPDLYLSGESSAVVQALSGGPALPTFRLDRTASRSTLVHNAETLARVALASRFGADAQRGQLLTVADDDDLTVVEADGSTTVATILESLIGPRTAPSAVLIGGYGGRWLPWREAGAVVAKAVEQGRPGFDIGAGVLWPLPAGRCGVQVAADIAAYLADRTARQCGPCMFGLPAVNQLMSDLACGRASRRSQARLVSQLTEIGGRGACHHPDGAVRMIASALSTFAEDVDHHLRRGRCAITGERLR
ncbi:NADH-ubiquinone oxidoreductase-F iron-sulfur binding region domain-containing protein [Jatrophihabitans sp.]|uniref:NADH-ubiquinone oxidoreductase-F iron-sulfur binding region domain-containing protein n=1 Tax=Jatrophihabitans sp. TaxID=1932789 RepID=UPI0030C6F584|nr:dehydrogenase [Jatrophihabitans sp.]